MKTFLLSVLFTDLGVTHSGSLLDTPLALLQEKSKIKYNSNHEHENPLIAARRVDRKAEHLVGMPFVLQKIQ